MILKGDICGSGICRPGGFAITDRAMEFCNFNKGARLADIGCGLGATVRHVREHYGIEICGVDNDKDVLSMAGEYKQGELLLNADSEHLPFKDDEMDGLIFECSFSKMENTDMVLAQCARVLKPQGYLIISDFYSKGKGAQLSGLLGRVDTKETLTGQIESSSFNIELFEDESDYLKALWGQLIFEYGAAAMYGSLGTNKCEMGIIKCGYCLIVARNRK